MRNNSLETVLNLLPDELKQTIYETAANVETALEIVLASVLSVLSMVIQAAVKVTPIYSSEAHPVFLYIAVIADSGDRKSSADNLVSEPLLIREMQQVEAAEEENRDLKIRRFEWKERLKKAEKELRKALADGDEAQQQARLNLETVYAEEPVRRESTHTIFVDTTTAALVSNLAGRRRSKMLRSNDAGQFFKHKGAEFASNVNQIWDGSDLVQVRKSGDSSIIEGCLTISIMMQSAVFSEAAKSKQVAFKESGFFARFLISQPQSLQGERTNVGANSGKRYLNQFHARIEKLQDEVQNYLENNAESRVVVFSPEAAEVMRGFSQWVELRLGVEGQFRSVNDAGSKAPNNAARIAALLHVYQYGLNEPEINAEIAKAACELAAFYLFEYLRVFGEKTVAQRAQEGGERLLRWLQGEGYQLGAILSRRVLQQYGPNSLRKKADLELAIGYLCSKGKLDYFPYAKPACIQIVNRPDMAVYEELVECANKLHGGSERPSPNQQWQNWP